MSSEKLYNLLKTIQINSEKIGISEAKTFMMRLARIDNLPNSTDFDICMSVLQTDRFGIDRKVAAIFKTLQIQIPTASSRLGHCATHCGITLHFLKDCFLALKQAPNLFREFADNLPVCQCIPPSNLAESL